MYPLVPDKIPSDGELFVAHIAFVRGQCRLVLCANVLLEGILRLARLPTLLAHKLLVLRVGEVVQLKMGPIHKRLVTNLACVQAVVNCEVRY